MVIDSRLRRGDPFLIAPSSPGGYPPRGFPRYRLRILEALLDEHPPSELEKLPPRDVRPSLLVDFLYFLRQNKKWWMLPIVLVLGMVGLLTVLASTGAAPFIYTRF